MKLFRILFSYLLICSCIFISSSIAYCETYVSGNITSDTTWTKANSPYIVTATVQVYPGATLIIEPGVTIKFNKGTGLVIGHKLVAIGTEQQWINFTSNAETPDFEDWTGIYFRDSSIDATFDDNGQYVDGSILKFCNIEYSNGIRIETSSPYITLNKIQHNWMCPHGDCCHGTISLNYSNSIIEQNEIINNEADSAICSNYSSSYIVNNIFTNNTSHNGGEGSVVRLLYCNQNHKFNNNEIFDNYSDNGLRTSRCPGIIQNNIIENSGTALMASSPCYYNTTSFVNNEFLARNNNRAILLFSACPDIFTFHNNNIYSETGYSIESGVSYDLDATNNWWGTTNASVIDSKIFDYYDDFTLGKVIYQPISGNPFKNVDFSGTPTSGASPLEVQFNNESIGTIDYIMWDFGDGHTSTSLNPSHVYSTPGLYNVSLTISSLTSPEELKTETKFNYISVNKPNPSPIYRFWSNTFMHHFYTISEYEKNYVITTWPETWTYEGPAFYAYPTQEVGTLPVYRFWSDVFLGHFYTISESEKDFVIATWPDTWTYEGPVYYAYTTQVTGTSPIYRFWSNTFLGHFYTISESEKDFVIATWPDVWTYEGPVFYAYPSPYD